MDPTEQIMEYQRREYILLSRMAQRQRGMRKLQLEANEAVEAFSETQKDSLRGASVDPVINIELAMLRQQIREKDQEIAKLKEETHSAQFQPNSIQGQKLLQKCSHLLDENAEFGRQLGEERMQVLRIQLTAERQRRLQLRQRIAEYDRHAEQVDGENERMQKKIAELGQSLKAVRGEIDHIKKDIDEFKLGSKRPRTDEERRKHRERHAVRAAAAAGAAPANVTSAAPASAAVQMSEPTTGAVAEPSRKKHRKGSKDKNRAIE